MLLIKVFYSIHYDTGLVLDTSSYLSISKDSVLSEKMKEYVHFLIEKCSTCGETYEFKSYEIVSEFLTIL